MKLIKKDKLDRVYNLFTDKLKNHSEDILWKVGVYSKFVKNYKALEQGKLVEGFLRDLMGATDLDTDEKSVADTGTNGDYRINSGIDINLNAKSVIQQKGVILRNGELGAKPIKVFDLSRNTNSYSLNYLLDRIGYEEVFQVYVFDSERLEGRVLVTSLSEMAQHKLTRGLSFFSYDDKDLKESMESLFRYNGSSHYLICLKDVYDAAKANNRVYSFKVDKKVAESYINKKSTKSPSVLEEII